MLGLRLVRFSWGFVWYVGTLSSICFLLPNTYFHPVYTAPPTRELLRTAPGPTAAAVAHCGSGGSRPHGGGVGPLRFGRPQAGPADGPRPHGKSSDAIAKQKSDKCFCYLIFLVCWRIRCASAPTSRCLGQFPFIYLARFLTAVFLATHVSFFAI